MRLTIGIKTDFINSLMADIPEIDYNSQIEKLAQDEAASQLPTAIKSMIQADKTLLPFLAQRSLYRYGIYMHVSHIEYKMSDDVKEKCVALEGLRDAQSESRREVKGQMEGLIASFTTVKALEAAIPELAHYLPPSADPTKNLPVSNAIASLMTAGWKPKKNET